PPTSGPPSTVASRTPTSTSASSSSSSASTTYPRPPTPGSSAVWSRTRPSPSAGTPPASSASRGSAKSPSRSRRMPTGTTPAAILPGPLARHEQGSDILEANGLPVATTVAELRELLGVRSPKQLGYFLLASDANDGPYTKFTIPKRDGRERPICAPKPQLMWT